MFILCFLGVFLFDWSVLFLVGIFGIIIIVLMMYFLGLFYLLFGS